MKTSLEESNSKYEMAFWLTEIARALPTFKLTATSNLNLKRTDEIVGKYIDSRRQHFKILLSQYAGVIGLKTLVTAGLLVVGAILLIQNSITIGQFVASEIVIILILNSSEKLIMSMEAIYDVLTSIEKLGVVTDMKIEEDSNKGIKLNSEDKIGIVAKDLEIFGTLEKSTINKNLNFEIAPGKSICLTGDTGSGKSSILKILSTSLDNYAGTLLYNGIPLQNLNIPNLRKEIGCIIDNQEIFYGTILENISLGRENVLDKDVIEILKQVGLDKLIDSFPKGYNHLILNSERVFSGTDRVRLIVARALVTSPKLVFAEDLFSVLKPENGELLLKLLFNYCKDKTLVIVSNNHQVIDECDAVIELS